MIVTPAVFENGRTIWQLRPEQGDRKPPRPSIWIDGFVRPISPGLEALWITLTLCRCASSLCLPIALDPALRDALQQLTGIRLIGRTDATSKPLSAGILDASVVVDIFDAVLAGAAHSTMRPTIAVASDIFGLRPSFGSIRIVTNAGTFRRHTDALDRVGELAAAAMVAPIVAVGSLTAMACKEELVGIVPSLLCEVSKIAGVELILPFAETSVGELGNMASSLGIPAKFAFGWLFDRYQMHPQIIGKIYRSLGTFLPIGSEFEPAARIAAFLGEAARAAGASNPGAESDRSPYLTQIP